MPTVSYKRAAVDNLEIPFDIRAASLESWTELVCPVLLVPGMEEDGHRMSAAGYVS